MEEIQLAAIEIGRAGEERASAPPETSEAAAARGAARSAFSEHLQFRRNLYQAAIRGDWDSAGKVIRERDRQVRVGWTATVTVEGDTPLMVALRACQWEFGLKLVCLLSSEELRMQNVDGYTALHFAAMGGNLRIVQELVARNRDLPQIANNLGHVPLVDSLTINQCKEVVWFLCLMTKNKHPSYAFTGPRAACLVRYLATSGLLDILFYLLRRYPDLAFVDLDPQNRGKNLLYWLSTTPSNFMSGNKLKFWERWIYKVVHVEVKDVPPQSVIAVNMGCSGMLSVDVTCFTAMWYSMRPRIIAKVLQGLITSLWNADGQCFSTVSRGLRTLLWKAIGKRVPCIRKVVEVKSKHNYAVELAKNVCVKLSTKSYAELQQYFYDIAALPCFLRLGTIEVVEICLEYFPDFINLHIGEQHSLFQAAIVQRREKIFNLLLNKMPIDIRSQSVLVDSASKRALRIVASFSYSTEITSIPGAVLQMQKELQWFKAVEELFAAPWVHDMNEATQTPWKVFKEDHEQLAKEGEKWVKDTSTSGMLVTTLIATVAFAAIFTIPGGNISDKGHPIFLRKDSFILFVVSDSLALFSSIASLVMFLSVLTARYAPEDFLFSLPNKIIIGLGSLFIAIASMMVSFGSTLYIVLRERWQWVSFPIIILAGFPMTLFVILQLPLFIQMVISTYGGGIRRKTKLQEFRRKLE